MAALIGGILLGILAMLAAARFGSSSNQSPDEIVRDIADVPKMAQAVAEKHRDEQYTSLTSVEEVIALPTEFARSEALYVLAGRSDSAGVQNLIFEANRIADDVERVSLLNILFFRLAETDPLSALALARTGYFNGIKSIERTVWRAWARKDLEDALFAAKTQTSMAHQNSSAQSLYAAFGYMGNETTERIEAELGIGPDRSSRGRYLYQLADRSPAEAIAFINGLERGTEQRENVSWLAHYVSLQDPSAALRYADLFRVASDGEYYSRIINGNIARENPHAAIERLLANGNSGRSSGEYQSAMSALASTDLDAAKQYFEQARSSDDRMMFGSAIASEMAKKDPVGALAWARANDKGPFPYLQMSVLGHIAQTDPQLALTEALDTPNVQMRSQMVSMVVQHIARNDPADAVTYLDQVQDRQQKLEVTQQLASSWIQRDPEAAIDWILSQDKETAGQLVQMAALRLLDTDIDAAIRMLPRVGEQNQESMRQQIAQRLATSRSPDEAQSFIRQFVGQPGYDQLQASLISGVARTDVLMAKQLADQLADGNARDRAYVQVIAQHAQTNPTEAARWLRNVTDERMRGVAAGQLAAQWYAHDPAAAARWVTGLPAGSSRDDAIMQMSSQWRDATPEQEKLIASIEDRDKRGKAKIRQIYNVMRTNPAKARKLLEDEDIPSYERQRVETMISQYGSRF
jgi:hypothetical protein